MRVMGASAAAERQGDVRAVDAAVQRSRLTQGEKGSSSLSDFLASYDVWAFRMPKGAAMAFHPIERGTDFLLPPSAQDWLSEAHLAR